MNFKYSCGASAAACFRRLADVSLGEFLGLTPQALRRRLLRRLVLNLSRLCTCVAVLFIAPPSILAQTENSPFPSLQTSDTQARPPMTNQEFVRLLYQLPTHPEQRDKLVDEIRKRGINFPLTDGLRSLVATKSGNDALLRRTLEEAERKRLNPTVAKLPPVAEANDLLERTRTATLGAAERMPDFLVKQQIRRSRALGQTNNWSVYDHLTIAVSYRQSAGEQYKLLSVNGMPPGEDEKEGSTYGNKLGGATSTGEYVSILSELFKPETRTEFQVADTDLLRDRRTIVYEYVVQREFSHQSLRWGEPNSALARQTIVGYRGRIWVDRETNRVLRLEDISTEIPPDFPITAATNTIDYDWVTINEQQHLLPSRAIVEMTDHERGQTFQARNEILFRGYRMFGADVKIIDIDEKDFPPDKPEENEPPPPPKKPDKP